MLTSGTSLDVVSKPSARFALARTSGSVLTLLFPHVVHERIATRHLLHKLLAISIMFVGVMMVQ
jgi:hypothetical protein